MTGKMCYNIQKRQPRQLELFPLEPWTNATFTRLDGGKWWKSTFIPTSVVTHFDTGLYNGRIYLFADQFDKLAERYFFSPDQIWQGSRLE